jgi:hypothetical protein
LLVHLKLCCKSPGEENRGWTGKGLLKGPSESQGPNSRFSLR